MPILQLHSSFFCQSLNDSLYFLPGAGPLHGGPGMQDCLEGFRDSELMLPFDYILLDIILLIVAVDNVLLALLLLLLIHENGWNACRTCTTLYLGTFREFPYGHPKHLSTRLYEIPCSALILVPIWSGMCREGVSQLGSRQLGRHPRPDDQPMASDARIRMCPQIIWIRLVAFAKATFKVSEPSRRSFLHRHHH
jgi:hypothetical protein